MVFKATLSKIAPLAKGFSAVRNYHAQRGVVGSNLPFQIDNRYRLLAVFIFFFGSAASIPFIGIRRMVLAKNQG